MLQTRRDLVFIILAGFFITNAVVAEMIGGKLIQVGPFVMSIGIIPWPVVFLTTDLINEHFGKKGVRRLSMLTALLIAYAFILLFVAMATQAVDFSPVQNPEFTKVFGQSMWIIVGSIVAFLVSQLLDVTIFWYFRHVTRGKQIWLRATGSTAVSQLIDTFIVGGIGFWLPGKVSFGQYFNMSATGYVAKLIIAISLTPLIYAGHAVINAYLQRDKPHA